MDRRKVLKNLGMAAGFAVASPGIFSLLQSCTDTKEEWVPLFFSTEEGALLQRITEMILPEDENVPGALKVNVPQFIDKYMLEVEDEKGQKKIQAKMAGLVASLKAEFGDRLDKISDEELDGVLAKHLRADADTRAKRNEAIFSYDQAMENGEALTADHEMLSFSMLHIIRDMSIGAFRNSEFIGEKVLAYDPVPGQYLGCAPLQELTGGKAWSL